MKSESDSKTGNIGVSRVLFIVWCGLSTMVVIELYCSVHDGCYVAAAAAV